MLREDIYTLLKNKHINLQKSIIEIFVNEAYNIYLTDKTNLSTYAIYSKTFGEISGVPKSIYNLENERKLLISFSHKFIYDNLVFLDNNKIIKIVVKSGKINFLFLSDFLSKSQGSVILNRIEEVNNLHFLTLKLKGYVTLDSKKYANLDLIF